MTKDKIKQMLPIGSIVQLTEGTRRFMIMGRFHRNLEDGEVYDYAGCLYPEGYQGGNTYYLFNHEHIESIHYQGFMDDEENQYRALLISKL